MAEEIHNWGRDIYSYPAVVVTPQSVEDLQAIMRDETRYPAPVRATGSNHSTTACATADGGTLVVMERFDRIIDIGEDTVTAQAGALYIDVAAALEERGRQLFVNVELGNHILPYNSAHTTGLYSFKWLDSILDYFLLHFFLKCFNLQCFVFFFLRKYRRQGKQNKEATAQYIPQIYCP